MKKDPEKAFWTVPNVLSLLRIALVPVFVLLFFAEIPCARQKAIMIFLLAGATDVLDGYIARKYHLISLAGRILDPLADKLMVVSALICLTVDRVIPLWLVLLYTGKELTQAVLGFLLMHKIKDMPPSNLWGKLGTLSFYVTIVTLTLFSPSGPLKSAMLAVSYVFILCAFTSYLTRALRLVRQTESKNH